MDDRPLILVTGASGFLGKRIVKAAVALGFRVRALARAESDTRGLPAADVEVVRSNVLDREAMNGCFEGVDFVIHAAVGTGSDAAYARSVTVSGTRNVLELCREFKVKKVVYLSSCSVYESAGLRPNHVVDEAAPLEPFPERRGAYSAAKIEAEMIVLDFAARERVPIVIVRPGLVYGPGGEDFTLSMGFRLGNRVFVVIDDARIVLPLVYVDDVADAILCALTTPENGGAIYNVVDPDPVCKRDFMTEYFRAVHPRAVAVYIPLSLFVVAFSAYDRLISLVNRRDSWLSYRLAASQSCMRIDASRIMRDCNWRSRTSLRDAARLAAGIDRVQDDLGSA